MMSAPLVMKMIKIETKGNFVRGTPAKCLTCGKTIYKIAVIHRFCSAECRDKFYAENPNPDFSKFESTERYITCHRCGKIFLANVKHTAKKFCDECAEKLNGMSSRRQEFCSYCGKPFLPKKRGHSFCSEECEKRFFDSVQKTLEQEKHERVCKICGKTFFSTNRRKKYCSYKCVNKAAVRKQLEKWGKLDVHDPKKCVVCGKEFIPSSSTNIYCSPKCKNRHNGRIHREKIRNAEKLS